MMEKKLHLLDSFDALGDDGLTYRVHGYEHLVRDASRVDGLEQWEPTGVAEYRLADGERVQVDGDGRMRICATGITLRTPGSEQTAS